MAEVNLWAPVTNGKFGVAQTADNTSADRTGTGELGKEAFLQLLVAQMKYQDPLNPTSDTEYISQLATFSSLEEMQNINSTLNNMQSYNLVGQYVMLRTENSNGEPVITGGKVDYAFIENNKAYLHVNGSDYSIDDLDTVAGEEYVKSLSSYGTETINDLAQAAGLIGKSVTVANEDTTKPNATGVVEKAFIDKGRVYLTVNSKDYLYSNLISVNPEEVTEETDYLELLTKDVSELKELLEGSLKDTSKSESPVDESEEDEADSSIEEGSEKVDED